MTHGFFCVTLLLTITIQELSYCGKFNQYPCIHYQTTIALSHWNSLHPMLRYILLTGFKLILWILIVLVLCGKNLCEKNVMPMLVFSPHSDLTSASETVNKMRRIKQVEYWMFDFHLICAFSFLDISPEFLKRTWLPFWVCEDVSLFQEASSVLKPLTKKLVHFKPKSHLDSGDLNRVSTLA